LAAALAAVLACAPAAQAQTIERTTPLVTVPDGIGGFSAFFGDAFTGAQSGQAFADLFTFTVSGTAFDASASLTSSFLDAPGSRDLLITGLSLYRYDPQTLAVIGNAVAGIDLTGAGPNPVDSWALSGLNLVSGAYALRIDGQVVGGLGGSFGADLTVSPVPEAPMQAMLLAGLVAGAFGWQRSLRRRPAPRQAPGPLAMG
jgi:hypothetical protein